MPKVIASQLRAGNVVEIDNKLYTVLKAESIHPGKGTPVTQLSLRRISDGVKVDERYKTTDQVERVFIDERDFSFLFSGEDGLTFMDVENYEQIAIDSDIIGDLAKWLQEGMVCQVKLYEGKPVAISIPDKVTLEITETEPTVKGQTASSSYKPAVLSNGVRIMVPPHISAGIRVVVNTYDDSYIERAKD